MTMTLKSSDLFTFVKLVAKLFRSSDVPTICFHPNGGNIKLCAFGKNAMLTMQVPRDGFLDAFAMRLDDLKSVVTKKTGEITFDLQGKNAVQVQSEGVLHRFLTGKNVNDVPYQPSQTSTHSAARLFGALNDAACCIDRESTTALAGICFRAATSQIVSTTGCQLLVQDGYEFEGWGTSDVVCPASKIFNSKELKEIDDDEVSVGLVNGYIYFGLGAVEIYLKAIDGVFPKVAKIMETAPETTYLTVDPGDADFVLNKLPILPGGKDNDSPVYLSLDVAAWLRAYNGGQKTGVALELSRSTYTGKSTSVSMSRLFLKNTLQFGCCKIGIDPTGDKPVICTGDDRTFIYVPLTGKEPEAEHMDVIASDLQPATVSAASAVPKTTATVTAPKPVKRRRRTVKRDASVKRDAVQPTGKMALLVTAEQIRNDLRNSLMQVNSLIREVKAQRQKDRLLQNTMDNLRKLSL